MRRSASIVVLLACCFAAPVRADEAQEIHDFFQQAAGALGDRKADSFEKAFDRSMPGFSKLQANVAALMRAFDAQSTIEVGKIESAGDVRSVQLNWLLDITERGGSSALTHRRAQVQCQLKNGAGEWRIVSFTPLDFFAPPQVSEAWTVLVTAALGLTEAATGNSSDVPAANTTKFMQAFDPAMPGLAQLRDNVLALEQGGDVESSVDLVKDEGDDGSRTIEVDWLLNLIPQDTGVTAVQRRQMVTCRLQKQGKRWRITSLEPRALFAPR